MSPSKQIFKLVHEQARKGAENAVRNAHDGFVVTISEPSRSLDQNAAQWPILDAIAKQIQWPVNGKMVWLSSEDFKDIMTAAFRGEQVRLAQGIDGGVVMLGQRTSKFSKKDFSEWLEFLHYFCADRGVEIGYRDVAAA